MTLKKSKFIPVTIQQFFETIEMHRHADQLPSALEYFTEQLNHPDHQNTWLQQGYFTHFSEYILEIIHVLEAKMDAQQPQNSDHYKTDILNYFEYLIGLMTKHANIFIIPTLEDLKTPKIPHEVHFIEHALNLSLRLGHVLHKRAELLWLDTVRPEGYIPCASIDAKRQISDLIQAHADFTDAKKYQSIALAYSVYATSDAPARHVLQMSHLLHNHLMCLIQTIKLFKTCDVPVKYLQTSYLETFQELQNHLTYLSTYVSQVENGLNAEQLELFNDLAAHNVSILVDYSEQLIQSGIESYDPQTTYYRLIHFLDRSLLKMIESHAIHPKKCRFDSHQFLSLIKLDLPLESLDLKSELIDYIDCRYLFLQAFPDQQTLISTFTLEQCRLLQKTCLALKDSLEKTPYHTPHLNPVTKIGLSCFTNTIIHMQKQLTHAEQQLEAQAEYRDRLINELLHDAEQSDHSKSISKNQKSKKSKKNKPHKKTQHNKKSQNTPDLASKKAPDLKVPEGVCYSELKPELKPESDIVEEIFDLNALSLSSPLPIPGALSNFLIEKIQTLAQDIPHQVYADKTAALKQQLKTYQSWLFQISNTPVMVYLEVAKFFLKTAEHYPAYSHKPYFLQQAEQYYLYLFDSAKLYPTEKTEKMIFHLYRQLIDCYHQLSKCVLPVYDANIYYYQQTLHWIQHAVQDFKIVTVQPKILNRFESQLKSLSEDLLSDRKLAHAMNHVSPIHSELNSVVDYFLTETKNLKDLRR